MIDRATVDSLGDYLARIAEIIAEKGWAVQAVGGDTAAESFCYTVGLAQMGHPELWIGTLDPRQGGGILNAVAQAGIDGKVNFAPGEVDVAYSTPFRLHGPVDPEAAEAFVALRLQGDLPGIPGVEVRMLQVLWPDEAGRFPGDDGYDAGRFPQRLLEVVA